MSLKNAIGGVALIASTAIGAAILALPVATAHLGFIQTSLLFLLCWVFMTLGALYVLEANLFVGLGTNLISMAEKTLGSPGKYFTWGIYLTLLYALTAAHLAGAGVWLQQHLMIHYQITLVPFKGALIVAFLIVSIILLGTYIVDWINRLLMIGLISIFGTLVFITIPHIQSDLLFDQPTTFSLQPLSLIITAFGSAIVIPSLTEYLKGNARQLVWVVLVGSLLPLVVYLVWECAILGVIPFLGDSGLYTIQQHGHPITDIPQTLEKLLHHQGITRASSYFSLFALIASFLGLCLSLVDFLADGLHIKKNLSGKLILAFISFFPPLFFILYYPHGFTLILSLAGIFVALLLGILPALMVYSARYHLPQSPLTRLRIPGGKYLLLVTIAFFVFIIGMECFNQWQILMHSS